MMEIESIFLWTKLHPCPQLLKARCSGFLNRAIVAEVFDAARREDVVKKEQSLLNN